MTMSAEVSLGRDFLVEETGLAVARYRDRLLDRLDLPEGKGKTALDLGCGDGMEAEWLADRGWKVLALDLFPHPKWESRKKNYKGKLKFGTADAATLSKAAPGVYDFVFQKDMLHHVPEPGAVLAQMKKKVKKGGRLAVLECNRFNPIFYVHLTLMGDHQHFTRGQLSRLLDAAELDDWKLKLIEARVWPINADFVQDLMDVVQNIIEVIPPLRPFICYHLAEWQRA